MFAASVEKTKGVWLWLSATMAVCSVIGAVVLGPRAVYLFSLVGGAFAVISVVGRFRNPTRYPRVWIAGLFAAAHGGLLIVGLFLQVVFLQPFGLKPVGALTQVCTHTEFPFSVKIPETWICDPYMSGEEAGFLILPGSFDSYSGASEVRVSIRELTDRPASVSGFLQRMAKSMTAPAERQTQRDLELTTETVELIDGTDGVLAQLRVKQLWIPMLQLTVFGIKGNRYFCSVSATGLEPHGTHNRALCLKMIDSIRISLP